MARFSAADIADRLRANPGRPELVKIVIPDYRPLSWNKLYAGQHWTKRRKAANEAHMLVNAYMPSDVEPYAGPVDITVTAYFRNRPLDADNVCSKLLIDGLIGRVLVDDSPRYVRSVHTVSAVDKVSPRVEIEITEV